MSNATATSLVATFTTPSPLLRKSLLADALLSGVTGLVLALLAGPLAAPLGLSVGLLRWSGIILIPCAGFVARLGKRARMQRPWVFVVVACNAVWALDSVLLLVAGWIEPTLPGEVFVLGQAAVAAVLAELQFIGLRRSTQVEGSCAKLTVRDMEGHRPVRVRSPGDEAELAPSRLSHPLGASGRRA